MDEWYGWTSGNMKEKCTIINTTVSVTLEMSKEQALAFYGLFGDLTPAIAQEYISKENYEKLYKLWLELDRELEAHGLVSS